MQAFHDQTALIREMRKIWGTDETRVGKADRSLVSKWENEMGFSREMILATAPFAAEAKQPMVYLDKILANYKEKGINTPEEARREHEKSKTAGPSRARGKTVSAQDYDQRDYQNVQNQIMEAQRKRLEDRMKKNGGESDA